MLKGKTRGFSLIELLIVIAVMLIASAITLMSIQPALKNARINNAYNTTLMALRQARDSAASSQQTYTVSFGTEVVGLNTLSAIQVTQNLTGTVILNLTLPTDMAFAIQANTPNSPTATPDGFGVAGYPVDLAVNVPPGGTTTVTFYPDGTARNASGIVSNGIVYISRASDLLSSRAITVWGATGRMRGWRLYPNGPTNYYWRQQ
jgi:prepilin-type N-terminal cleavage/methylation domain-containing protein